MNNLDKQYTDLLQDILDNGVKKGDRTGTGTISVFGRTIRHKMSNGFPLLTTKRMAWKGIVTEMLWFLRGDTNIKYLVENNNNIWTGDAYKNYLQYMVMGVNGGLDKIEGYFNQDWFIITDEPYEYFTNPSFSHGFRPLTKEEFVEKIKTDDKFAKKWGYLGPIYGKQWRQWCTLGVGQEINGLYSKEEYRKMNSIDQIANLINDLKKNPDSRRLMVNAWNVAEIDQMVLPPCHYGFQVYTRELSLDERNKYYTTHYLGLDETKEELDKMNIPTRAISLMWNQRSVDTFLGLPFNIASYGLLLEMLAKEVNMVPDELIGSLGDTHLYLDHIEQAKEQITREPYQLPILKIDPHNASPNANIAINPHFWDYGDFHIEGYQSHSTIKANLSN